MLCMPFCNCEWCYCRVGVQPISMAGHALLIVLLVTYVLTAMCFKNDMCAHSKRDTWIRMHTSIAGVSPVYLDMLPQALLRVGMVLSSTAFLHDFPWLQFDDEHPIVVVANSSRVVCCCFLFGGFFVRFLSLRTIYCSTCCFPDARASHMHRAVRSRDLDLCVRMGATASAVTDSPVELPYRAIRCMFSGPTANAFVLLMKYCARVGAAMSAQFPMAA